MDENRLSDCSFQFADAEREKIKKAFESFATSGKEGRANAVEAFIDELVAHVPVASQMPTVVYGPVIQRVAAVKKAANNLCAALQALTDDDIGELYVWSSRLQIGQAIQDVQYRLPVLTTAADGVLKHVKPNQHARYGQEQANQLILVAARAWAHHFGKRPSVSRGSSANYGVRESPFASVMQVVLGILEWPAGFDFIKNAFADIKGDIRPRL